MSELGEVVREIILDTYGVDCDELDNVCEDVADAVQMYLMKKLNQLNCVGAEYGGKNRPCVDIAVVLNTIRCKEYDEMTEKEKDREYQLTSRFKISK